ncbi:MAG: DegT/DnrJ/EryC1/StrS family aminotransferase [Burkholderiales bacterium]|nr:DegT/DnrJ/EryC1/StrS family aminotransferase [Burkholderiales bacterium]
MTQVADEGRAGQIAGAPGFPPWPVYAADEIEAAAAVLRSGRVNYWTGSETREFEREYASHLGVRHAVALANGTVAIEAALHALGIGAGDEVVVTSRSFVASAACVALKGAVPVFADIDPDSQNVTATTIEAALSPRTRAILLVHLGGWPCEMDPIMTLARARGIKVIEDCAQAHGATYRGRPVGGLADIAVFSFCQDKIISTGGEGGLLATDDAGWWRSAWEYKDHGKNFDKVHHVRHPPGFRWLHDDFGTNARMTEFQAAIGRLQLRKLPEWHVQRTRNARMLAAALAGVPGLRVPMPPQHMEHAYYRLYAYFDPARLKPGNDQGSVIAALERDGVPASSGSCAEMYLEQAFARRSMGPPARLPMARASGETSLAFPVHPGMEERHLRRIADKVAGALRELGVGE